MKILRRVILNGVNKIEIKFGIPITDQELDDMFKFRYESYTENGYIKKLSTYNNRDIDEYDFKENTKYIIAKLDDNIIGSVRMIKDEILPIQKYCFKFDEPSNMVAINKCNRAEISRLIARYPVTHSLPPHFIMMGLLSCLYDISQLYDVKGGYAFIKKMLFIKLSKLKVPIYKIEPATMIYNKEYMRGYFFDPRNPVLPVYYITEQVETVVKQYFEYLINNGLLLIYYET